MKNVVIERLGKTRVRESQEERKRWTGLKMEREKWGMQMT